MTEEKKIIHIVKSVYTILLALFFLTPGAFAEEYHIRNGFWGGFNDGAGLLKQFFDNRDENDTHLF